MFEIGQFIIYGNNGVCKVVDIGTIDMDGISKERLYYTLEPYYVKGSRILTPTDNKKTVMRPLMTREDAETLFRQVKHMEMLWVPEEKKREEAYKSVIATCDWNEWMKVIKTIYFRQQKRMEEGKKITVSDERYFKLAENCLYSELAVVFNITKEEAKDYMLQKMDT